MSLHNSVAGSSAIIGTVLPNSRWINDLHHGPLFGAPYIWTGPIVRADGGD